MPMPRRPDGAAPHPRGGRVRTIHLRLTTLAAALAAAAGGAGAQAPAAPTPAAGTEARVVIESQRVLRLQGLDEQFATGVVDVIDAAELARVGGSTVAASVIRVPSITIQDGRYVFVRGLGDRYVTTTLNGATLPSTDPSRRTVPLDLFPRNLVQQLAVRKTFTAAMPAESTGGNLLITTRSLPQRRGGSVAIALGGVGGLTGSGIHADPLRGDGDYFGFDDGIRRENGLLPLIGAALRYGDEFSPSTRVELQRAGGLLIRDSWDLRRTQAAPDLALSADYGDVFGLAGGGRAGFFVAGNFGHATTQRDEGRARSYGSAGQVLDDFDFVEHARGVEASGLVALGWRQGVHSLASTTLASRVTDSVVRVSSGFDGDELLPSLRHSIDWTERQFVSQQFSGDHDLGGVDARWQLTLSQARRDAPDRREVRFDLRGGDGLFNLIVPSLLRRYDELTDDNLDVSTDWEWRLGDGTARAGVQLIRRERESTSRSYGFSGGATLDDNAPGGRVDEVLTIERITGDPASGYAFIDKTLASDAYTAELDQQAAYLEYDRLVGSLQWVLGVRAERFEQSTETFALAGDEAAVRSRIDERSLLPSLSLNWFVSDEAQLRLGLSRTVARPDFKETSNATFYDTEFDFRVRGNPLLQPSEIVNLDLRFEHYGDGGANSSVALFHKRIDRPIERVVQPASGTAGNSRTFRNADEASVVGIEAETRRNFRLATAGRSVFLAFNGSLIRSKVRQAGTPDRELQGQPEYTANLIAGFDDAASGQELTLLLNQNGPSIQDVGVNDLPDVVEEPRASLNLRYRRQLAEGLELALKLDNLLDRPTRFTQGGQVFQEYRRGIGFEAGLDWSF